MTKFLGFSHKVDSPQRRRFAFAFVCESGELEIKSALLAASLCRNLRCRYELIACVSSRAGRPSLETLSFLKKLGARLIDVENPLGPDVVYAIKIACLAVPTTADKIIYIDSDMLCTGPFDDEARFLMPLNFKPADLQTFTTSDDVWRRAYRAALLDPPDRRLVSTVSEESGYPYFNGGWLAANKGADLAAAWLYCAKHLNADASLPREEIWSDQPSLAVAVHLMGCAYDVVDERYNFPAHLRPIKDAPLPLFTHYHWPNVVRREPQLTEFVQSLADEHPELVRILSAHAGWRGVLAPYAVKPRRSWRNFRATPSFEGPDVILTGIPRSGAGHLAGLVRKFDNCAVAEEPPEVVEYLRDEVVPTHVATYFRELRRSVLDGPPGSVQAADFVAVMKNTQSLPFRLDVVASKVLPAGRLVACVRNPIDTIAAWKNSFPHLHDAHLIPEDRAKFARIAAMTDLAERRAWWWRFFAEILLRNRERLVLARYEDFAANPLPLLEDIFRGARPGRPRAPIVAFAPSGSRDLLDARDREAILSICSEPARELGVPVS